jgi:hypothetical protein
MRRRWQQGGDLSVLSLYSSMRAYRNQAHLLGPVQAWGKHTYCFRMALSLKFCYQYLNTRFNFFFVRATILKTFHYKNRIYRYNLSIKYIDTITQFASGRAVPAIAVDFRRTINCGTVCQWSNTPFLPSSQSTKLSGHGAFRDSQLLNNFMSSTLFI